MPCDRLRVRTSGLGFLGPGKLVLYRAELAARLFRLLLDFGDLSLLHLFGKILDLNLVPKVLFVSAKGI